MEFIESPATQAVKSYNQGIATRVTNKSDNVLPIHDNSNLHAESVVKSLALKSTTPKRSQISRTMITKPNSTPNSTVTFPNVTSDSFVTNCNVYQRNKLGEVGVNQGEESAHISSFLLGLEELLSDGEQEPLPSDDDDDFQDISRLKKSRSQLGRKTSDSTAANSKTIKTTARLPDDRPATTTQTGPPKSFSVVSEVDTTADLFGDSFNDSVIEAACESVLVSRYAQPNQVKSNTDRDHMNSLSSQFDIDVDCLLLPDEKENLSDATKIANQNTLMAEHQKRCESSAPNLHKIRQACTSKNITNLQPRISFKDCMIFVRTRVNFFHFKGGEIQA